MNDEVFRAYQELYAYERRDLMPTVERVADTLDWRQETVTYDAGHDGERVIAHLFLPKQGAPPRQAVIYFPYAWALGLKSSQDMEMRWLSFLLASGRAVLAPVFKGTYERRLPESDPYASSGEWTIAWAKEVGRSIDFLETRKDIDPGRIAYYGFSEGTRIAPVLGVVEKRLKTLILLGGGFFTGGDLPPQMDPFNFAPRTHLPVLMVSGKDDFWMKEGRTRMFDLLKTPPDQKRLALLEGGHHPARLEDVIREVLDWLDRYLGPVRRG